VEGIGDGIEDEIAAGIEDGIEEGIEDGIEVIEIGNGVETEGDFGYI
jgi:hypothetical protein